MIELRLISPDGILEIPDQPHKIGDKVKVISGLFKGDEGTVTKLVPARERVKVLFEILGRPTEVEINEDEVDFPSAHPYRYWLNLPNIQRDLFKLALHLRQKAKCGSLPAHLSYLGFSQLYEIQKIDDSSSIIVFVKCPLILHYSGSPFSRSNTMCRTSSDGKPTNFFIKVRYISMRKLAHHQNLLVKASEKQESLIY